MLNPVRLQLLKMLSFYLRVLKRTPLLFVRKLLAAANAKLYFPFRKFYSQFDQDRFIYENFFKDKYHGVFVDVGANDGIFLSNTYFFEKQLKWTGMCIEPHPITFKKLKKNRKCLCIEGCIAENTTKSSFLQINGPINALSGMVDRYNPKHLTLIESGICKEGGNTQIIEVQCYNLSDLLKQHHISHINYLNIDTEGGELKILQSIDFNTVTIDVIGIENNYGDSAASFLEPLGYKKVAQLGVDEIYCLSSLKPQSSP